MNNQEYIIINKTAIQQRIEELEKSYNFYSEKGDIKSCEIVNHTREELKQILSQSIPLIPELEKAILFGHQEINPWSNRDIFISNLKLDI